MKYLKVEFYVPIENVTSIIDAINDAGLIKEGNYDYCYAYSPVKGHFRPLDGSKPYIGQTGIVEEVDEVKVEFRIESQFKDIALKLIEDNHPYEVPVINFIALV